MPTLGKTKAQIAGLFNLAVADFTINGEDMLTAAINHAVRKAQLNHSFERTKVLCQLSVDGAAGGAFADIVAKGTADPVKLLRIIDIGPYDDDNISLIPQTWMTYDEYKTRQRSHLGYEYDPETRYPAGELPSIGGVNWVIVGETLMPIPAGNAGETQTVGLYGVKLFGEYATGTGSDELEDMFLLFGSQYIQWEAALYLNHLRKEWVPRQEGNLPPPTTMRNEGWDALVKWDTYQYIKFPEGGL